MIKGVNKQVLEINETQNDFFEKAIFFVKPEYSGMSEGRLREKATNELNGICRLPNTRHSALSRKKQLIFCGLSFFAGILGGIAFCSLL